MARGLPEGIRKLPSGKYQARYPVTENGVTRQVSAGTHRTLQDAKDARSVALAQRKTGTWVDPAGGRLSYEQWVMQWRTLRRVKDTNQLRSFLKVHILPAFGHRQLKDITPVDVQRWVNGLQDDRRLAPSSIAVIYAVLRRSLNAAVELDLIGKSPCRSVVLPTVRRHQPTPLTHSHVERLLEVSPPRYRAMLHLAAFAGLRWQEAAALRWENVDLTGSVHVCEAVKADGSIGLPKNGKKRYVSISPTTTAVLVAHRRDFGGSDLVTPDQHGRLQRYDYFREQVWSKIVKQAKLPVTPTFHDLRHFFAARAVVSGIDWKVLSEQLGHHSPSFTLDKYGYARPDAKEVVSAAVEGWFQ